MTSADAADRVVKRRKVKAVAANRGENIPSDMMGKSERLVRAGKGMVSPERDSHLLYGVDSKYAARSSNRPLNSSATV